MFVCKKENRSGTTSVIVVNKSKKRFRELKTIGTSSDEDESEIDKLYQQGEKWLSAYLGKRDMFAIQAQEQEKSK
jgi:hypothetical protein